MKKLLFVLFSLSTFHCFSSEFHALHGFSLEESALAIEDYQSEGFAAIRLSSKDCFKDSSQGKYCVLARKENTTKVVYGMSLESSALAIEEFRDEGFFAVRLNKQNCNKVSTSNGNYCVLAKH